MIVRSNFASKQARGGENQCMPRTARASVGGYCCHALNGGNERARVFHGAGVTTQTAFGLRGIGDIQDSFWNNPN